jgi:hypothetical protein
MWLLHQIRLKLITINLSVNSLDNYVEVIWTLIIKYQKFITYLLVYNIGFRILAKRILNNYTLKSFIIW